MAQAVLFPNGDGTASGRFAGSPHIDYLLSVKDAESGVLMLEVVDAFTGDVRGKLHFELKAPQTVQAALLGQVQTMNSFPARENPTWVLVRRKGKGPKWAIERRISAAAGDDGSLI